MNLWKQIKWEECPECGATLEASTDCDEGGMFYDGDDVRCTECDFESCISVDSDDGSAWVQG